MDKEKILSQNKKENLYLDEYEKHIKLQGKSFGLMFVLFICILILFIKAVCKEPYYDIMTIIGSVAFGCKLCLNGMPVPLLRNCYSIFNGTKYR